MIRTVLFDLDGTLTDSKPGILNCVRYALEKLGEPIPTEKILLRFIGPPLQDSFREYCGFEGERCAEAIRLFRERYVPIGKFENAPAEGMAELCARLQARGYRLALASSKPEAMCCAICEHFGFAPYLECITGSDPEVDWSKEDVIREALRRMKVSAAERDQVLMVGDRRFDVEGAAACGIACVGVEFFGYAEPGELEAAGAAAVVRSARELEEYILTH